MNIGQPARIQIVDQFLAEFYVNPIWVINESKTMLADMSKQTNIQTKSQHNILGSLVNPVSSFSPFHFIYSFLFDFWLFTIFQYLWINFD